MNLRSQAEGGIGVPRTKEVGSYEEYSRVAERTEEVLTNARGELIGLFRQIGRRVALAPAREYVSEFVEEVTKEDESISKKAEGAYKRYNKATAKFRKKSRSRKVRGWHEHMHTVVHDLIGLSNGITALAEAWAEEVEDLDLVHRIQARQEAGIHEESDEDRAYR